MPHWFLLFGSRPTLIAMNYTTWPTNLAVGQPRYVPRGQPDRNIVALWPPLPPPPRSIPHSAPLSCVCGSAVVFADSVLNIYLNGIHYLKRFPIDHNNRKRLLTVSPPRPRPCLALPPPPLQLARYSMGIWQYVDILYFFLTESAVNTKNVRGRGAGGLRNSRLNK